MAFVTSKQSKAVSGWLFLVMVLVIVMILVGGATRLTNSGLSITEWNLVSGTLPPMSAEAWATEFEKYQQIPEFSQEHPDMDLTGFKFIYFMEWTHRQLGRLIGLAYVIPLLIFAGLQWISPGRALRFFNIFLLILLQGAIGWWMVKSGLTGDRIDVAPYRLAVHLGLAFIILGCLYWTWRDQKQDWPIVLANAKFKTRTAILVWLIFLQIILGALVAGSHAGLTYNTWPMMDGRLVPSGLFVLTPWWKNIFENVAAIQFNHRMLAYILFVVSFLTYLTARRLRKPRMRRATGIVFMFVTLQMILGIVALLKFIELPYALAHQAGAIVVFLSALSAARTARVRSF